MIEVCVVDANGVFLKTADLETYVLEDGENFVSADPPTLRPYTGYPGFVKPVWDGSKWGEGATFPELIKWEATHPKTSDTANKTIWQTLDDSYAEGVNTAYDQ